MKKYLITGASSQLAQELLYLIDNTEKYYFLSKQQLNIASFAECQKIIEQLKPDIIINTAAITDVDQAERNLITTKNSNELGVKNLAKLAHQHNIKLIHLSTNYVFKSNTLKYHKENDKTQAINHYGQSKLNAETILSKENPSSTIIRTSTLFSPYGHHFTQKILSLLKEKKHIKVVNDQYTQPTDARELARFILYLVTEENQTSGIIHFTGKETLSWYEFAQKIALQYHSFYNLNHKIHIDGIPTEFFPTIARRPIFALLDNTNRNQLNFKNEKNLNHSLFSFFQRLNTK